MNGEATPPAPTDGRPPVDEKSNRKSVPVRNRERAAEASSTIGETVEVAEELPGKAVARVRFRSLETPLVTQRWR